MASALWGAEARAFANFLHDAGQAWWQILPVGPAGAGDSPYASESTFAGNPLFIDLDLLAEDGLLDPAGLDAADWGTQPRYVDYGKIYDARFTICARPSRRAIPGTARRWTPSAGRTSGWKTTPSIWP